MTDPAVLVAIAVAFILGALSGLAFRQRLEEQGQARADEAEATGVKFYLLVGTNPPAPDMLLDVSVGPWGLLGSPRADRWQKLYPKGQVQAREMPTDLPAATWWPITTELADLPTLGKLRLAGKVRDYPFGARWVTVALYRAIPFGWNGADAIGPGVGQLPYEDAVALGGLILAPGVDPVLVRGGDVADV